MYGYVVINKPEMKFKEYDEYRGFYCGLCHCLKEKYGVLGSVTLSYDLTFLAILLSGLYETEDERSRENCLAHPFEKHLFVKNQYVEYVADMSILLAWHKCQDDWQDERDIRKKLYGEGIKKGYKRVCEKYPEKARIVEICMKNIMEAEKRGEENLDVLAGYFGKIMAEVFVVREDLWEVSVREIGVNLGKFVYILDAYEDLEEDERKKRFNPLINRKNRPMFHEEIQTVLKMYAAFCAVEFEKLPVIDNISILRNILYSGIWSKYEMLVKQRKEKDGPV